MYMYYICIHNPANGDLYYTEGVYEYVLDSTSSCSLISLRAPVTNNIIVHVPYHQLLHVLAVIDSPKYKDDNNMNVYVHTFILPHK